MNCYRNFAGLLAASLFFSTLAHSECALQELGNFDIQVEHYITDAPALPSAIGFQLADLSGKGELELVEAGGRYLANDYPQTPSIAVVQARTREGDLGFTTRASLAFPFERLLAVTPVDGSVVGATNAAVVVVTRSTEGSETRVRVIDGPSWTSSCYSAIPIASNAAATGVESAGGQTRLFLQGTDAIRVYSLPDLIQLRELPLGAGDHFALAQLDDDDATEIIIGGTPGRIIDGNSGDLEWTYEPGFLGPIAVGNFGSSAHQGFVTAGYSSVDEFSGAPYGVLGSVVQLPAFQSSDLAYTIRDINSDGRDEVVLILRRQVNSMSVYSVRAFDSISLQSVAEDTYDSYPPARGIGAIAGRAPGTTEIIDDFDNKFKALRVHVLGSLAQTWSEGAGNGVFAVSEDNFNAKRPSIAYADGEVHVIDSLSWVESARLPINSQTVPLNPVDLAAIHTQEGSAAVLGGSSFFGAIASFTVPSWSIDWSVGVANDPNAAPFGGQTIRRMQSHSFDPEGSQNILVAAGGISGLNPGALIGLIDGVDGHTIWISNSLGTDYATINDVEIAKISPTDHRVLATGSQANYVFDILTGQQLWSDSEPGKVVAPIDQTGTFAISRLNGSLAIIDASGSTLLTSGVHGVISAMKQPLLGGPLLVASAARLRWVDPTTGAQLAVSAPFLTPLFADNNRWIVRYNETDSRVHVIAASEAGLYGLSVALPSADTIFYDGNE